MQAKQSAVFTLIRSELNEFLFAPIGEERNGMTLSVFSGLARLGVDPWAEAARLANLPNLAATEALARTIARMSGGSWQPLEAPRIAARLIGLLPKHGVAARPDDAVPSRPQPGRWWHSNALVWVLLGALVIVMIATHGAALVGSSDHDQEAPISADAPRR